MAHYLSTLDTTARHISVPTVTLVGDFVIEWRGAIVTNGIFAFAGGAAGTSGIDLYRNNSGKYQLLINTQSQIVSTVNASNSASSPDIVRIERVGSVFTLYVNSVSQGNVSLTPSDVKIQRIFHRDGWGTYGNQALYSLAITGSDPRNYDANASGGTGNILPETINALNGTQAGTWPADNSEWVFYSAGTAPTGTVTIGTIVPSSTGAVAPFTYSAADQTGFEYQLNETGTLYPISASPATPTGLTSSTAYTIRVRAKNASGDGAWSASAPFTTSAATAAISFNGTIPAQVFTNGQAVSVNLAPYFSGTLTPFTFANTGALLTGIGLSITSAGLLTGTATTGSATGIIVTGTDASLNTAASNAFNVTVNAASVPVAFTGTIPAISGTQNSAITPVNTSTYFTGSLTPFTYSLFSGTLPTGITLNSSTGIISGTPTVSFTGNIIVRATDTGSNTANSNSISINIAAATVDGILTSKKFGNNTGQLLPNLTGLTVYVYNKSTGALIVTKTSETTDANGICVVSDALIVSGTQYVVVYTNGTDYGIEVLTAT